MQTGKHTTREAVNRKCAIVELHNVAYVEIGFPFVMGTIYFDSSALFRQIIHKMVRNAGAPKV